MLNRDPKSLPPIILGPWPQATPGALFERDWLRKIRDYCRDERTSVRIGGHHYTIAPDVAFGDPSYRYRGHGGREFVIEFTAGPHKGRVVVTHNLWGQGEIPPEVRIEFPDNARFITHREMPNG